MNALATALAVRGPFADVVEQAELVAGLGYDSIWVPEIAGRDALVTCAALAAHVPGTPLATGIVPLPTRSPVLLAMGAAALGEVTGGHFTLGVGAGHVETVGRWFGRAPLSLAEVRAHLEVLATLLAEGRLERPAGDGLPELSMTLRGVHAPAPPPVLLAALGPRMARLAGAVADGVVCNWTTPERTARIAAWAREGARAAGRDPDAVQVACYLPTCVGDADAARAELARQLAAYGVLVAYRRRLEEDLGPFDPGAPGAAVLDALGAHGDVAEVAARIAEHHEAGATVVVLTPYPEGEDPWASLSGTWASLAPA